MVIFIDQDDALVPLADFAIGLHHQLFAGRWQTVSSKARQVFIIGF